MERFESQLNFILGKPDKQLILGASGRKTVKEHTFRKDVKHCEREKTWGLLCVTWKKKKKKGVDCSLGGEIE